MFVEHGPCCVLKQVMCLLSHAGYESGSVSLVDVHSPKVDVMAYEEHIRAIHRMMFFVPG